MLIYRLSDSGEFARDFGLRDQMRRAAISIMSNIAEGFESRSDRLFANLLGRARGSAGELRSRIHVAVDAGYISEQQAREVFAIVERCSRQISNFMWYLHRNPIRQFREDHAEYNSTDDLTDPTDLTDLTTRST
ncbi:MAG: four helix bundle protein [Thermoflexales bacterium]|nr:four helix bundle protein [Thermoflexales bacterium]